MTCATCDRSTGTRRPVCLPERFAPQGSDGTGRRYRRTSGKTYGTEKITTATKNYYLIFELTFLTFTCALIWRRLVFFLSFFWLRFLLVGDFIWHMGVLSSDRASLAVTRHRRREQRSRGSGTCGVEEGRWGRWNWMEWRQERSVRRQKGVVVGEGCPKDL